jgi:hypothetical protein
MLMDSPVTIRTGSDPISGIIETVALAPIAVMDLTG